MYRISSNKKYTKKKHKNVFLPKIFEIIIGAVHINGAQPLEKILDPRLF